jgi:hypothetical protein
MVGYAAQSMDATATINTWRVTGWRRTKRRKNTMIRGDLNYDSLSKWVRLFEEDLLEIIRGGGRKGHEDACRYMLDILQDKLSEYEENRARLDLYFCTEEYMN